MFGVLTHMLRRRAAATIWWTIGLIGLAALLAVAYPTVRGNSELDKTFADLPPGVASLLGLSEGDLLTSPSGYLNSQMFANILPMCLLIFGIGAAAWTVAGDEAAGTFELLVTNPISRTRVALARYAGLTASMALLALASWATLAALATPTKLTPGVSAARLAAATAGAGLLALVFATVAFAVGAAVGSRPAALAIAAGLAVAGYVIEGLAHTVPALRAIRAGNPWHWLLAEDPLRHGLTWQTWLLPVAECLVLIAVSLPLLARRDLR